MKNRTHADPIAIEQICFDEDLGAKRVVLVGGSNFSTSTQVQNRDIQVIEVPVITTEVKIIEVDKIIVQKEVQIEKIEVPVYIDRIIEVRYPVIETVYKTIEIPVTHFETKIVEIPLVIKEYKDLPKWVTALIVVQAVTSLLFLLLKFK